MEGYSHLREDVKSPLVYGMDFPVLEYFSQVRESDTAFVFFKDQQLLAVIVHSFPNVRYKFGVCSARENAEFKSIQKNIRLSFERLQSNSYQFLPVDLKPYEGCLGVQCDLMFRGE